MKSFLRIAAFGMALVSYAMHANSQDAVKWVNVELETAGNLGVEILYQADYLSDVTHLRVSGPINSADWTTIKNLSNIVEIDLSKAVTTTLPSETFSYRGSLNSIQLPETLVSIENKAFYSAGGLQSITIPATVETLGDQVFYESAIRSATFDAGSALRSIGYSAFSNCQYLENVSFDADCPLTAISNNLFDYCSSLAEVNIPNNVTSIGGYAMRGTTLLKAVQLPENLTSIGSNAFYNSGLESISIPRYVKTIPSYAFYGCRQLQEAELSPSITSIDTYGFSNCTSLTKMTLKAPVPPTATGTSINNISQLELIVPDFAVPSYRLDTYWLQCSSISGGAISDYMPVNGSITLSNDRRMDGTPTISINTGGSLSISGNAAQSFNEFTMNFNIESVYGLLYSQFINSCPLVSANSIKADYYMPDNSWRFISLPFDVNVDEIAHSNPAASFVTRYYDGATRASLNGTGQSWKDFEPGSVIKAGTGIIVQTSQTGTLTFPCADAGRTTIFNPDAVTVALAANPAESSANSGWNFVANPFPCFYDLYYAALSCPITVYNTRYSRYDAYSMIDDDYVLSPDEPFFIQASEDISEVVFSTRGRQLNNEVSRAANVRARNAETPARSLFNFKLSSNGLEDAVRVVLNPEASAEYETNRDASKFLSDNAAVPQIYTIIDGDYLSINELPESAGTIRLGYYAPASGAMTLSPMRLDGRAILHDAATGADVVLTEGSAYSFIAENAGFDNSRFTLTLAHPEVTGIGSVDAEAAVKVAAVGNTIRVENADGLQINIYSLDGMCVINEKADTASSEFTLPSGTYVVRIAGQNFKCILK